MNNSEFDTNEYRREIAQQTAQGWQPIALWVAEYIAAHHTDGALDSEHSD